MPEMKTKWNPEESIRQAQKTLSVAKPEVKEQEFVCPEGRAEAVPECMWKYCRFSGRNYCPHIRRSKK